MLLLYFTLVMKMNSETNHGASSASWDALQSGFSARDPQPIPPQQLHSKGPIHSSLYHQTTFVSMLSSASPLAADFIPAQPGISKLQALIRRRQSGRFNEVNAVLPLARHYQTGDGSDEGPPGLLYVTNLPGATAVFTATPPYVAAMSPAHQLLRNRNIRCIVSLLSPTGEHVRCTPTGDVLCLDEAATACASLRPYLGTAESPRVATRSGYVVPYPVYIRVPVLEESSTAASVGAATRLVDDFIVEACRIITHHEAALQKAVPASEPDGELRVPVYHIHVPVEDNHTTHLASFLPLLLPIMHLFMCEGGSDSAFRAVEERCRSLLPLLGIPPLTPLLVPPASTPLHSAPTSTPKSWAALASVPGTPMLGSSSLTVSPCHAPTDLPPTFATLVPGASQCCTTPHTALTPCSGWVGAHRILHTAQHQLRILLGDVVAPHTPKVSSSWVERAHGAAATQPGYPCSVLVHCLQGISRSGSVAIAYGLLHSLEHPDVLPSLKPSASASPAHQQRYFAVLDMVQQGRSFIDPNAAFRCELMQISQAWCVGI